MRRSFAALLLAPIALSAQRPVADPPALARALESLKATNAWTLSTQAALCEIPAPPFKETARGIAVRNELVALGYADARIDEVGNVVAEVAGASRGPTGAQSDSAPIVRAAIAAAQRVGLSPTLGASSTDANYPISLGVPAITIDGGGTGEGAHSVSEWYADGPKGYMGPQWTLRLIATLAGLSP